MLNTKKNYLKNINIYEVFLKISNKYPNNIFLSYPSRTSNAKTVNYTYNQVLLQIENFSNYFNSLRLRAKNRVSIMIGNVPEFFILKLALNSMGISCVPINADLSIREINYIINHSNSKLLIADSKYTRALKSLEVIKSRKILLRIYENGKIIRKSDNKVKRTNYKKKKINSNYESSLLYTSGTTGKPKACILTHEYEINAGLNYIKKKDFISLKKNNERIYNCLPVHHVNAGILSFYAALMTANCQIQSDRFSASNFWREIKYSKATVFHYLGVMASLLLKNNRSIFEKNNSLRVGVGAGIEPSLHKLFEKRFKIPMIELWGMTEMVRCIFDHKKDRDIGMRCIGNPQNICEIKVVNELGKKVNNKPGEMLIRYSKRYPRQGFFNGYYKDKKATSHAWEGGWFKTGDLVIRKKNKKIYFLDRKKNIIRRAGENISATEVEAVLMSESNIKNCAVISYPHNIYEEEVLSFIILKNDVPPSLSIAKGILHSLNKKISYFKLPGFIQFCNKLPISSSQKIEKRKLTNNLNKEEPLFFFDLCKLKTSLKKRS